MSLAVTETALEGFRLFGRRPLTVLAWAVFYLAACAPSVAVFVLIAGPQLSEFLLWAARGGDGHGAPPTVDPVRMMLAPFPAILVGLACLAVLKAAVCRAILRPAERGLAGLAFGGDELRLIVVC